MNKKTLKRQRDLKTKLTAAISMLLVSSLMMVTSTYAWFTLSTAPEVTGITTAVGANGNLEMALLPTHGDASQITSSVGDSMDNTLKSVAESNITWGNLVDLSNTSIYGLDKITLFPSALNLTGDTIGAALLTTPKYGADGRISELAQNTMTGVYSNGNFTPDSGNTITYGVRAVGTASGMTERQLDYRNARSSANTARTQAASTAASALNNNGSALANIAIQYGMHSTNAKFDQGDLAALRAIINALQGEGGVFDLIEKAYMQYILAYAASANQTDDAWLGVKGLVEATNATLASVQAGLAAHNVSLPADVASMITAYDTMVTSVEAANSKLKPLEEAAQTTGETYTCTWGEIRDAMTPLVDPAAMTINGFLASEVKDKLGDLVTSVTSQGGLKVIMASGAGVFADIADHTEDYTASITIEEVNYNDITLKNMAARMETDSDLAPNYHLAKLGTVVMNEGAPASGALGTMPITDMYGYVVDLAFRTNAAESNLMLQQTAVDRIYSDNTNEETMGHGATMTFKATTTDFSNDQVKSLMSAIRIVFFDPGTMKVINYAKLDTNNATSGTDGWTSKICLYEISEGGTIYTQEDYTTGSNKTYYTASTTYTEATDAANAAAGTLYVQSTTGDGTTYVQENYVADSGKTYYTASTTYTEATDAANAAAGTLYVANTTIAGQEVLKTDNVIMPLTQNSAHRLSVLVYLDGTKVTNGSVAATAATSMTGSMNLQFSSSAALVPMDYADLHTPGTSTSTTYNVTVPTGVTGEATATANTAYNFTVNTGYTLGNVTVGGTAVTPTSNGNGSYTIPAASVTGAIVINVTGN